MDKRQQRSLMKEYKDDSNARINLFEDEAGVRKYSRRKRLPKRAAEYFDYVKERGEDEALNDNNEVISGNWTHFIFESCSSFC